MRHSNILSIKENNPAGEKKQVYVGSWMESFQPCIFRNGCDPKVHTSVLFQSIALWSNPITKYHLSKMWVYLKHYFPPAQPVPGTNPFGGEEAIFFSHTQQLHNSCFNWMKNKQLKSAVPKNVSATIQLLCPFPHKSPLQKPHAAGELFSCCSVSSH